MRPSAGDYASNKCGSTKHSSYNFHADHFFHDIGCMDGLGKMGPSAGDCASESLGSSRKTVHSLQH